MPRTESIAPVLLANMQIFARCGGVHGTLALDVDMWHTVRYCSGRRTAWLTRAQGHLADVHRTLRSR